MKIKLWAVLSEKIADGKIDMDTAIRLGNVIEELRHVAAVKKYRNRHEKRLDKEVNEN